MRIAAVATAMGLAGVAAAGCQRAASDEGRPGRWRAAAGAASLGGGAPLPALPLRTCGRWIVDGVGKRFKLASVNWYGASDVRYVVGGLDRQPVAAIARTVRSMGFNSVRLPFSSEMLHQPSVRPEDVAANPELAGKTPLEVLDAVVSALTAEGLVVILNNHTTHAMWCCGYEEDGLWFSPDYPEERWIEDWEMLAERYRDDPGVVGVDLRNEIRVARASKDSILPRFPRWGGGGAEDWRAAATRAGNRVLRKNPHLLVIIEGLDSADNLQGVEGAPVSLDVPDRVVYSAHNYEFERPGFPTTPGIDWGEYKTMSWDTFQRTLGERWGYVVDQWQPYTAPVWVGEFGDAPDGSRPWMENLVRYLRAADLDWGVWPLNGGRKPDGSVESYALLEDDWKTPRADFRLPLLQSIVPATQGPGVGGVDDACPGEWFAPVPFDGGDTDRAGGGWDWAPSSWKGTCAADERVVGLAQSGGHGRAALCSRLGLATSTTARRAVMDEGRDSPDAGSHTGGDWAPGFTKLECAKGEVVAGVSQQARGGRYALTGVLCATSSAPVGATCVPRTFDGGDDRATPSPGDWAKGAYKGQCAADEHVAGVSTRGGAPHSILCCR